MLLMAIRVLFLCTGNSARSQIAEGLLRQLGGTRFEVFSAGTKPRPEVNPMAVRVMKEHGVDISAQRPKDVTEFEGRSFDFAITVCDRAKESCPILPGAEMIHWSFPDPAEVEGEEASHRAFRAAYQGLKKRIELFITVQGARS